MGLQRGLLRLSHQRLRGRRRVSQLHSPANPVDPFVGCYCVAIAKGHLNKSLFKILENVNSAGCSVY